MSHERLWAPWRLAYVAGAKDSEPTAEGCFLCRYREETRDAENFVVSRGEHTITVLNRFPYNNGHVLVAPLVHKGTLDELDDGAKVTVEDALHGRYLVVRRGPRQLHLVIAS